jgi:hypothetical protein
MIDILSYLEERREEFERHLKIARMLESRVDESLDEGGDQIEVRHVNTVKSGLLIHLYNIVEAITTRTLETVGRTIVTERPALWKEKVLNEWIRAEIWSGEERIGDGAVKRLTELGVTLASGNCPPEFAIKGEPGSWNDQSIKKVAQRLGCELVLSSEVRRGAYEPSYRNETTALTYLANRRNSIAHGASTFEEGAYDLTLNEIDQLANKVLPYLEEVANSYRDYLENKRYLVGEEVR